MASKVTKSKRSKNKKPYEKKKKGDGNISSDVLSYNEAAWKVCQSNHSSLMKLACTEYALGAQLEEIKGFPKARIQYIGLRAGMTATNAVVKLLTGMVDPDVYLHLSGKEPSQETKQYMGMIAPLVVQLTARINQVNICIDDTRDAIESITPLSDAHKTALDAISGEDDDDDDIATV